MFTQKLAHQCFYLLLVSDVKQEQKNSMNKQSAVGHFMENGKLLNNKGQWTIDREQLDISLGERSQSQSVLYDSISMTFSKRQSCSDGKELQCCWELKVGESESTEREHREFSGMMEEVCLAGGLSWTKLYTVLNLWKCTQNKPM